MARRPKPLALVRATLPPPHVEHVSHYGGLPSWLRRSTTAVGRVLTARAGLPAVSLEGEAIRVQLGGGAVLATAVGPAVPRSGLTPPPETTPTTFVVTLAKVSRPLAIQANSFVLLDDYGRPHRPRLTGLHGGETPREALPGGPTSFELHAVLPTGGGALRWAPEAGAVRASWDYTVEID